MTGKLFVINLKALASNIIKPGKKKLSIGRMLFIVFLLCYVIASVLFVLASLFNALLEPFYSAGIGWMYFVFLAIIVFGLCVINVIFTAPAQLFNSKDNELLFSMPVKPSSILISRLLAILTFEYVFALMVALPALAVWISGGYAKPAGVLFFITGVILLPLMAMAIALVLAWLLAAVTARLKHKNIITLTLSIGFLLVYFYIAFNFQKYLGELVSRGMELAQAFKRALPPFYAFGVSAQQGSAVNALVFALWALLPFAAAVFLLSVNYRRILITNRGNAAAVKTVYKAKKEKAGSVKAGSAFSALVRKETAHYWNSPVVILNSSIGSLFMLVLSVLVIVRRQDILSAIDQLNMSGSPAEGELTISSFTTAVCAVVLLLLNTFNIRSASLISLEGSSLWIVKSIPVPVKTVLQSKICVHLLISSIPCLIASVCTAAVFASGASDWLIIILLPQVFCVFMAAGGLALNLCFPKLDWTNEIQAVKQGLSAIIAIFAGDGIVIALTLVYVFLLSSAVSLTAFLWLCVLLIAAGAAALYMWLLRSGVKKFEQL